MSVLKSTAAFLALLAVSACIGPAATVKGRVADVHTGEPLDKVHVAVDRTTVTSTDAEGRFQFDAVPAGGHEITISAVGYGLLKKSIATTENEETILDIALHADAGARKDTVSVTGGAFESSEFRAASEKTLTKAELQALAMVLLADPLRAVQALPGVVTNNDFRAEFSVRGAGYDRVALFIDGVLSDNFVHAANLGVGNASASEKLSLATINADTISEAVLLSGAFPATIGDSSAAAVALSTREGNRIKRGTRVSLGLLGLSTVADGPVRRGKGSWLVAGRTSYADYLQRFVERITGVEDLNRSEDAALNFSDLQGKVVYDLSRRHQVGAGVIGGIFTADQHLLPGADQLERFNELDSANTFVNVFWKYTPNSRVLWNTRGFRTGSRSENYNRNDIILDDRVRDQVGARSDFSSSVFGQNIIQAGVYFRRINARKLTRGFGALGRGPLATYENYAERSSEESAYVQATFATENNSLSVTAGGRLDHSALAGQTFLSPRLAMFFRPAEAWVLRFGAGKYAQFPEFQHVFGHFANSEIGAERSTHYNLSLERTIGNWARFVVEAYDREDRGLIFSLNEARLVEGTPTLARNRYQNSLDGHSRGVELSLQARSSNRVTGWVSYALLRTAYLDRTHGIAFVSDFDQRHTANAFATYRIRPTVSISGQWRYGSGLPFIGFIASEGTGYALAAERNRVRLPRYSRLDLRANKAFIFQRWKLTLSGEVLNVLNRTNLFTLSSDPVRSQFSRQFSAGLQDSIGILPSVSVTWEF